MSSENTRFERKVKKLKIGKKGDAEPIQGGLHMNRENSSKKVAFFEKSQKNRSKNGKNSKEIKIFTRKSPRRSKKCKKSTVFLQKVR